MRALIVSNATHGIGTVNSVLSEACAHIACATLQSGILYEVNVFPL